MSLASSGTDPAGDRWRRDQRGIRSTIVAATDGTLRLLRRGPIEVEAIRSSGPTAIEAPGQLASHYAPKKPLRLDATDGCGDGEFLIGFGPVAGDVSLSERGDPVEAAAHLFDLLHEADAAPNPRIAIAPCPATASPPPSATGSGGQRRRDS